MPKTINREARKDLIAEAVWAIVSREGLGAASIRAVAEQCDLSVGSIQHAFKSQEELYRYAMELVVRRTESRLNDQGRASLHGDPLATATDLLEQLLPLDDTRETEGRVWLAFEAAALVNEQLAPYAAAMDQLIRQFCERVLEFLIRERAIDLPAASSQEAAALHALIDGLTVGVLADPTAQRRCEANAVLDAYLHALAERS